MGVFLAMILSAVTAAPASQQATWRKTGEFPLIAGTWREAGEDVNHGPILVTIAQHGGTFQAECTYQLHPNGEGQAVEIQWRMHGTISEAGEIKGILVHAKGLEGQPRQERTGMLDADGTIIQGHASFNDGGHNFTWTLKQPREAEKLFVVKFWTPDPSRQRPAKGNRTDRTIQIIAPSLQAAKDKLRKEHPNAAIQGIEEK